jgi:predicted TIM-barrel enzyme
MGLTTGGAIGAETACVLQRCRRHCHGFYGAKQVSF